MEPNPQEQTTNPTPPPIKKESSGIGPLIAIIVILLIIVAGGIYFWLNRETAPTPEEVVNQEEQGDQLGDLEAEIQIEDLEETESDLESIDEEF